LDYLKLAETIPSEKRSALCNKLVDLVLTSKNDEKMPHHIARSILHHWQQNNLQTGSGLATVLEAAILLEPEKTMNALNEAHVTNVAEEIKKAIQV
jgi:16S rRNA C1402 N4-methylase RsmH